MTDAEHNHWMRDAMMLQFGFLAAILENPDKDGRINLLQDLTGVAESLAERHHEWGTNFGQRHHDESEEAP